MKLGLIFGTGLDEMDELKSSSVLDVETRYGCTSVYTTQIHGTEICCVPRHGAEHSILPSQINHRSQIAALKKLEVTRILAVCAVGSVNREMLAGTFAVLTDFIDFTRDRESTFFTEPDSPVVHTDFSDPYCPELSRSLKEACLESGVTLNPEAVYLGVDGPRYESPAEIRLFRQWGADVVGMTNVPEVILAREAGICYGALAMVTNLGTGLGDSSLDHDDVRKTVGAMYDKISEILKKTVARIPSESHCTCMNGSIFTV